jgi:hypothetical protein
MSDASDFRTLTRLAYRYSAVLERLGLKNKDMKEEIRKMQEAIQMAEKTIKMFELVQMLMTASEAANPLTAPLAILRLGALGSSMALSEGGFGGR